MDLDPGVVDQDPEQEVVDLDLGVVDPDLSKYYSWRRLGSHW